MPVTTSRTGRGADAGADGLARLIDLDVRHAVDRVLDGVVAGAAAEVAFEMPGQILEILGGEGGRPS